MPTAPGAVAQDGTGAGQVLGPAEAGQGLGGRPLVGGDQGGRVVPLRVVRGAAERVPLGLRVARRADQDVQDGPAGSRDPQPPGVFGSGLTPARPASSSSTAWAFRAMQSASEKKAGQSRSAAAPAPVPGW